MQMWRHLCCRLCNKQNAVLCFTHFPGTENTAFHIADDIFDKGVSCGTLAHILLIFLVRSVPKKGKTLILLVSSDSIDLVRVIRTLNKHSYSNTHSWTTKDVVSWANEQSIRDGCSSMDMFPRHHFLQFITVKMNRCKICKRHFRMEFEFRLCALLREFALRKRILASWFLRACPCGSFYL